MISKRGIFLVLPILVGTLTSGAAEGGSIVYNVVPFAFDFKGGLTRSQAARLQLTARWDRSRQVTSQNTKSMYLVDPFHSFLRHLIPVPKL